MQYYEINEQTARRANDVNSMSDYRPGSATEEYRAAVDKAAALVQARKAKIHGNLPGLTVDLPANHDNFFHAQHRPVPLSYLFILGVTLRPGVPCQHSARRIITVVCRHPALLTRVSTRFSV